MATLKYPYLISKLVDPIFGIIVGVASFYVYEHRQGREKNHSLNELLVRRYKLELSKVTASSRGAPNEVTKQKRLAEAAISENTAK
ncbi:hypothetical protein V1512DRAFT_249210 [Lipomyces arxii]|uniref:uncharacterized protein n=1 Tax=Lipomyces arxii TaxID=56418 RepID=UPI0034CFB472